MLAVGTSCAFTVRALVSDNTSLAGTLSSGGATPASQVLSALASGFAPQLAWTGDSVFMEVAFPPGPVRTWTLTNPGPFPPHSSSGRWRSRARSPRLSTCWPQRAAQRCRWGGTCTLQARLSGVLTAGTYSADLVAAVPGGATATVSASVQAAGTPDAFSFAALTGQPGNAVISATPVRRLGFNTPIAVSATGGAEVTTDGGAPWASSGTLAPVAFLGVRVNTGAPDGSTRAIVVTTGGVSTTWNIGIIDQIPNAFSFAPRTGEELDELAVFAPVTPTGYSAATAISVSGEGSPQISVGGGAFTTATMISPGQSVIVRLTTAAPPMTTRIATVSIGSVSASWSVTTGGVDSVPVAFSLSPLTNQAPGAQVVSAPVAPTGFDASFTLALSGDGTPQVSSNVGATWAASLRLRPGQSFLVRVTAGGEVTTRTATVDAGGVQALWSVSPRALDTTPDAFSIPALTAQPSTMLMESGSVTPVGYVDAAPISVSGDGFPQIAVATGSWTTSVTISPGHAFRVRMTSPDPDGLTRTVSVSVGGVSASWSVTTIDTMPDPGGPFSVSNQLTGSCMQSPDFTFTGMTQPATFTAASQISGTADSLTLVLVGPGTVHGVGRVINAGETWRFRACAPRGLVGQPAHNMWVSCATRSADGPTI
jgi:hypothetical protein